MCEKCDLSETTKKLFTALLVDDHGITSEAYNLLLDLIFLQPNLPQEEMTRSVNAVDGRFYIDEDN